MTDKKISNPYGKLCSPEHLEKVNEVAHEFDSRGFVFVRDSVKEVSSIYG